uniref:Uncharacterized protein n=1 Tax=Micrurus corallinus TaxID=54390 RepID=A0A2D4EQC5_MICCO
MGLNYNSPVRKFAEKTIFKKTSDSIFSLWHQSLARFPEKQCPTGIHSYLSVLYQNKSEQGRFKNSGHQFPSHFLSFERKIQQVMGEKGVKRNLSPVLQVRKGRFGWTSLP